MDLVSADRAGPRRAGDPGPHRQHVTFKGSAEVVELMATDDKPAAERLIARPRQADGRRVGFGGVEQPCEVLEVAHVTDTIDVLGSDGLREFEDRCHRGMIPD